MKKLFLFLCLCLLPFTLFADVDYLGVVLIDDTSTINGVVGCSKFSGQTIDTGGGATNFMNDADCVFAARMNCGLSANGDDETDLSGEGHDLTETSGNIANNASDPYSGGGISRLFVATGSHQLEQVDGLDTDISGATGLTVVACIRVVAITDASSQYIIGKYDTYGTGNRQYVINLVGTATNEYKIVAKVSDDGGPATEVDSTTTDYAVGVWRWVALVYDEVEVILYVDGVEHCTPGSHTTGVFNGTTKFAVGCNYYNGSAGTYYNGYVDEVAVFKRALSPAEILAIKTDGIDGLQGEGD